MLNKIGCLTLHVSDLQKSTTFYRDTLGINVDFEMDDYVMFKTSGTSFLLQKTKSSETISRSVSLAFEIESGVDELCDKLQKKGVKFTKQPSNMEWGGRMALFQDPDGYEVGFYEMLGPMCEACGMPMKSKKMRGGGLDENPYCVYCCDEKGELRSRNEVREGMIKFYMNSRGKGRKESEKAVDEIMKWLPAWKDTPR